jgi:hypothetical protein
VSGVWRYPRRRGHGLLCVRLAAGRVAVDFPDFPAIPSAIHGTASPSRNRNVSTNGTVPERL